MSKKTTYIHAENNNKILSSNEVRLYVPPEPEKMKIIIWGKELCNVAEWNDFLKCVEEKTKENKQLKQQLEEKDKEIERLKVFEKAYYFNQTQVSQESMDLLLQNAYQVHNETQLAIQELEKVNGILTNTIIEVTKDEFDLNKLCYLEEISAKFYEKIQQQIKELKGE